MAVPQKDGQPLREHLESARRQAGNTVRALELEEQLTPPPMPAGGSYLWGLYHKIARGRPATGMDGIKKIPGSEIVAWCQLSGYWLEAWELDAIRRLDDSFVEIMSAARKSDDDSSPDEMPT